MLVLGLYLFHQHPLQYTEKKVNPIRIESDEKLINEPAPEHNYFNVVVEPKNLSLPPASVTSNFYNNPMHRKTLSLLANES